MDFKQYMTAVEKQLDSMTGQQMKSWILTQARIVDEGQRQDFLNNLSGKKPEILSLNAGEIHAWCEQVESGTLYFETEQEEYYEEGDWDSDWRTIYYDAFDIIPYLTKAFETCQKLVLVGEYETAYALLDRLCRIEFYTDFEEEDWLGDEEPLTLEKLAEEGMLTIDFAKLSQNLLYACYQSTNGEERLRKLYEYLIWKMCGGVKMTDVFAFGPEPLPGTAEFMENWHAYLSHTPGDRAAELLADACIYLGGEEKLRITAAETVDMHPCLYIIYCQRRMEAEDWMDCVSVGQTAVETIHVNKEIRGKIAEIAFQAAEHLNDYDRMKLFGKAIFFSKPDCAGLLRLYRLGDIKLIEDAGKRLEEITAEPFMANRGYFNREQRETNIPDQKQKAVYRFMLGDFEYGWEISRTDDKYLGWSGSFKELFVMLALVLLKKPDGNMARADEKILGTLQYRLRFDDCCGCSFETALLAWRNGYLLSEKQKEDCLNWLQREIDKRTAAVVGGGYRNSYHKAAELIVALGEILEENGEPGAMRKLVDHYKQMHSRKRAFRAEIDELSKRVR